MIDLFTLICVIVGLCLLRIIFSDGFEKGFLMIVFLSSFFGLPMYFMIKLDSGFGVISGLFAAAIITFTVGELFDNPKLEHY